jgi:membrane-associated phospholipid phosphatase
VWPQSLNNLRTVQETWKAMQISSLVSAPPRRRALPFLPEDALLAAFVAVYVALTVALSLSLGVPMGDVLGMSRLLFDRLPELFVCMAAARLVWGLTVVPPRDLFAMVTDRARLGSALATLALMTAVLLAFVQMKRLIPLLHPFAWDATFTIWDRALHFGTDPWRLAHAVAGSDAVLTTVTVAYGLWLVLMHFVLYSACLRTARRAIRTQYLLAFVLTWAIGGNLLATVFSSAGPVYVARLGLGDTFAPLLQILADHAGRSMISATAMQDTLWAMYEAPDGISGISAFPSMHVASSTLMAIYGFTIGRKTGIALTAFALAIGLGSVLLGWHYAIDGYAGVLVALAAWKVAGLVQRRFAALWPDEAAR